MMSVHNLLGVIKRKKFISKVIVIVSTLKNVHIIKSYVKNTIKKPFAQFITVRIFFCQRVEKAKIDFIE